MCDQQHPGQDDCFRPPDVPTLVRCMHCGQEYESFEIVWRTNADDDRDRIPGFWCCPVPGCDGKGFGFDILPVDPEFQDERGGWFDDGYEEECELWDSLDPAFDTLLWTDVEDAGPPRIDGLLGDPTPPDFVDPSHKSSGPVNDDELPF